MLHHSGYLNYYIRHKHAKINYLLNIHIGENKKNYVNQNKQEVGNKETKRRNDVRKAEDILFSLTAYDDTWVANLPPVDYIPLFSPLPFFTRNSKLISRMKTNGQRLGSELSATHCQRKREKMPEQWKERRRDGINFPGEREGERRNGMPLAPSIGSNCISTPGKERYSKDGHNV